MGSPYSVPNQNIYFCLPFTGSHSSKTRPQSTQLFSAAYPHLNISFVFRSSTRITSFFPFKDKVPKFLRSVVMHLLVFCIVCGSKYSPFTHQIIRTLGYLSCKVRTFIQYICKQYIITQIYFPTYKPEVKQSTFMT